MPKISVIMPVYNAERYLREAIDSILSQTYTDFEFIIIDDGSTDSSADIVRSFDDSRIRFYQNEHNMGVAATLNRGLDLAAGEYIARMDSDDVSLPERFAKEVEYLDNHPQCAVVGADMEVFGAKRYTFVHSHMPEQNKVDLLFASSLGHPTVMMRGSVFGANGLRYDETFNGIEDYELWTRTVGEYEINNLNCVLLRYRMHKNQVTQNHSARYVEQNYILKRIQLSELSVPTDSEGFTLFCNYCIGNRKMSVGETTCFLSYLDEIAEANSVALKYSQKALTESLRSVENNVLRQYGLSDIILVFKARKIVPVRYLMERFLRGQYSRLKVKSEQRKNRKRLKNRDFTIISNNCWGGIISEKYGLRKNSPTCGCGIHGNDYIRFCQNIHEYINKKLEFIPIAQSRDVNMYTEQQFPVAKLGDIEIYFMHYHSEDDAAEKWYRRCGRINWDNIVYKISEKETFDGNMMREFMTLPYENKICFSYDDIPGAIVIPELEGLNQDETELLAERFDEAEYLNGIMKQ